MAGEGPVKFHDALESGVTYFVVRWELRKQWVQAGACKNHSSFCWEGRRKEAVSPPLTCSRRTAIFESSTSHVYAQRAEDVTIPRRAYIRTNLPWMVKWFLILLWKEREVVY